MHAVAFAHLAIKHSLTTRGWRLCHCTQLGRCACPKGADFCCQSVEVWTWQRLGHISRIDHIPSVHHTAHPCAVWYIFTAGRLQVSMCTKFLLRRNVNSRVADHVPRPVDDPVYDSQNSSNLRHHHVRREWEALGYVPHAPALVPHGWGASGRVQVTSNWHALEGTSTCQQCGYVPHRTIVISTSLAS
jgi:hypothetical protein